MIINIVDAANLERNLYLTVQMMELGANLVIALNMNDCQALADPLAAMSQKKTKERASASVQRSADDGCHFFMCKPPTAGVRRPKDKSALQPGLQRL